MNNPIPAEVPDQCERLPAVGARIPSEPISDIGLDEHVQLILSRLRGSIHLDKYRLESEFVNTTSSIRLPETLSKLLPEVRDIGSAVEELKAFMKAAHGDGGGRLVVGKKGAGKTTLTHYAASLYVSNDPSLLFLAIDYQWIPLYEVDFNIERLIEAFFEISGEQPVQDPLSLSNLLRSCIDDKRYEDMDFPSLSIRNMLSKLAQDDGIIVGMYSYFC